MKDIDFDELDRAVSSLLGKPDEEGPAANQPAKSDANTASSFRHTPSVKPVSSPQQPSEPARQPATKPPASAKLPIAPQRPFRATVPPPTQHTDTSVGSFSPKSSPTSRPGTSRFMDVVPPNAVNKKPQLVEKKPDVEKTPSVEKPPVSPAVSRVGKTIPPSAKPSAFMDSLIPRRPVKQATEEVKATPSPQSQPDDEPELLTAHAGRPANEEQKRLESDVPPVLLPNPKVEKRPLGGSAPSEAPQQKSMPAVDAKVSVPDTMKGPESEPVSLPPELDEKLVAVEASEPTTTERPDTPPAYPEERTPKAGVTTAREVGKMAASIPQQYRTQQTTPDTTPRSIYDTEEYHAPLPAATPARKKKHPVVWTLLIILLLIIGAALGAGAYFLLG